VWLPWNAAAVRETIRAYEDALPEGAWPNWVLGNHDQSRVASRLGSTRARVAAMLLLTLRGTPTLYNGDELGLPDVDVPPDRIVDVAGRDTVRSPMPWSRDEPNAGFSTAEPWLPMVAGAAALSVEAQRADPSSMLELHRRLLAARRASPALHAGSIELLDAPPGVVAFDRRQAGEQVRVLLNLTGEPATVTLEGSWTTLVGTRPGREGTYERDAVALAGDEGLVLRST
jgi:alpha-glucosidase